MTTLDFYKKYNCGPGWSQQLRDRFARIKEEPLTDEERKLYTEMRADNKLVLDSFLQRKSFDNQ